MCGIVVGLAFNKLNQRDEAMRQKLLRYFTTELMIATEERGKDATGAAVLFNDGRYMGLKRGERSSSFLSTFGETRECYGSLLKVWREHDHRSRVYLGHCRAGTNGDKEDNENNHPIKIGNLVGIHNGQIRNHDIIFEKLGCKRDGEVDSESIFRLFEYYTKGGKEPFTIDMIQEIVNRLDGQFAITLFNADNLEQVPIFRDGRPVEFILIRRYGILLMVSEMKFWDRVHFRYERMANYYNDLHNTKLPSFIGKEEIVVEKMPDDTAAIFDLSTKVTNTTKMGDLCISKKMSRNDKMWKAKYGNYYNSGYNYNKSTSTGGTKATGDVKKHRVFDKITRQYVTKVGDKIPDVTKAATLPVDKETKDHTKPVTALVTKIENEKKSQFRKDGEEETGSSNKVNIEDTTTYDPVKDDTKKSSQGVESNKVGEITDVDPRDIEIIDDNLTEVQMMIYPPEVVEAANEAYEKLPTEQKGCGDLEGLLDAIEIKDAEVAEKLGLALIGNRSIKHGWLQGYMHALHTLPISSDNVPDKREKHIAGLKSLVILLAKFYDKTRGHHGSASFKQFARDRLIQISSNNDRKIDIDKVSNLFNAHDKESLKEISNIISEANSVAKTD